MLNKSSTLTFGSFHHKKQIVQPTVKVTEYQMLRSLQVTQFVGPTLQKQLVLNTGNGLICLLSRI